MSDKAKKIILLSAMLLILLEAFAIVCFAMAPAPQPILVPPAKSYGALNVLDFGAVCDGKTDDSAAVQKAFDAAAKAQVGQFVHAAVHFPPLICKLAKQVIPPMTVDIVGDGQAEILGDGNSCFVFAPVWRTRIYNLSFVNCGLCIWAPTNNIDAAMIDVGNCWFDQSCKVGIDTNGFAASRSTIVSIHDCVFAADTAARCFTDKCSIDRCWCYGFGQNHEIFVLDSHAAVRDFIFVPAVPAAPTNQAGAVFGLYASDKMRGYFFENVRVGAENGGFPPIISHIDGERAWLAEQKDQVGITVRNCHLDVALSIPGRRSVVTLAGNTLPNFIHFEGDSGTTAFEKIVAVALGWTCPPLNPEIPACDISIDATSRRCMIFLPGNPVADPLIQFLEK